MPVVGSELPSGGRVRVVLVDDGEFLLDTLVIALGRFDDIDVVATAVDGDRAVAVVSDVQPDVVLLDLRLGATWGLDLVPVLRSGPNPPAAIVVFSASSDPGTVDAVARAGVEAHVRKGASAEEIAAVLRAASPPGRRPGDQS